jgi:membrane-associated phospholipid phosphatase
VYCMKVRWTSAAAVAAACFGATAPAGAEPEDRLSYDLATDAAVTAVLAGAWGLSGGVFVGELAPERCRWCESNGFDERIREALRWQDARLASRLSDAVSFGLVPAVTALLLATAGDEGPRWRRSGIDLLLVLEATAAAGLLQHGAKLLVARERPDAHALPGPRKHEVPNPAERNLSYWSGHAATAMAMATSAGTVAWLRGYPEHRWIWIPPMALGLASGYLRIASDTHWATDVLAGTVIGSAVGLAVPFLFHQSGRHRPVVAVQPVAGAGAIVLARGSL